jgi:hypothetical protein
MFYFLQFLKDSKSWDLDLEKMEHQPETSGDKGSFKLPNTIIEGK